MRDCSLGETRRLWKSRKKIRTCPSPAQGTPSCCLCLGTWHLECLQVSNKQVFRDFVSCPDCRTEVAKGARPVLCRERDHEAGGGRCVSTAPNQAHQGQHISPGLGIALPLVQGSWGVCWGP